MGWLFRAGWGEGRSGVMVMGVWRVSAILAGLVVAMGMPVRGRAQSLPPVPPMPTDPAQLAAVVQRANSNQLGMLEYCQSQGSVGPEIVDIQKRIIAARPTKGATEQDAAAYAAGRKGTFQVNGYSMEIAGLATSRGLTVDQYCQTMAAQLRNQAPSVPR